MNNTPDTETTYTFTITATLTGTADEAWDQWTDLLTQPRFVEDGTQVVTFDPPPSTEQLRAVAEQLGGPFDPWVSPIPDADGNASEITDLEF